MKGAEMANVKHLPPINHEEFLDDEHSLTSATMHGTQLDRLKAMRLKLAAHIDSENTLARDLAALVRRFADLDKEISDLEAVANELEYVEVPDGEEADLPFDPASI